MSEQFAVGLDELMVDSLPTLFPDVTGRDIRGLADRWPSIATKNRCGPHARCFCAVSCFGGWIRRGWFEFCRRPVSTTDAASCGSAQAIASCCGLCCKAELNGVLAESCNAGFESVV